MIWAKDSYSNSVPGVGSPNPPTFVPSKSLVVSCEWKWVLFCAVLRSHSRIGTLERAGSAKQGHAKSSSRPQATQDNKEGDEDLPLTPWYWHIHVMYVCNACMHIYICMSCMYERCINSIWLSNFIRRGNACYSCETWNDIADSYRTFISLWQLYSPARVFVITMHSRATITRVNTKL